MTDGRGAEKRAKEVYEQAGYEVYLPPLAKYREQDVFGLFDLLCYRNDAVVGVQVKASRHARGINDWMQQARDYQETVDGMYVEFLHSSAGGWRLARPTDDDWTWAYDGREHGAEATQALLGTLKR